MIPAWFLYATLPLSAVQGLWLKRIATRLPGAPGPRMGSVGDGQPLRLLALGDSIIDGVGIRRTEDSLPVQFAAELARRHGSAVQWRIEGESGLDIDGLLERLRELDFESPPDLILTSIGVNDVTGLSSHRHWRTRLVELFTELRGRWPDARVLFAGLPPMEHFPLPPQPLSDLLGMRSAQLDQIAREMISQWSNMVHVPTGIDADLHDFCEDGFHPSAKSCTLWAEKLADHSRRNHHERRGSQEFGRQGQG